MFVSLKHRASRDSLRTEAGPEQGHDQPLETLHSPITVYSIQDDHINIQLKYPGTNVRSTDSTSFIYTGVRMQSAWLVEKLGIKETQHAPIAQFMEKKKSNCDFSDKYYDCDFKKYDTIW